MKTVTILSALSAVGASMADTPYTTPDFYNKPMSGGRLSQHLTDDFNILKNVGNRGPYIDRRSWGVSRETPEECAVDQVIMLMRHGERYPEATDMEKIGPALEKIRQVDKSNYTGKYEFLNDWSVWWDSECELEQETFTGPYSGLADAFNRGTIYRARYGHLLDTNKVTPIFATGYSRVMNTARKFGEGFFGYNYSTSAAMNPIAQDKSSGANSLAPSCWKGTDADELTRTKCNKFMDEMPYMKYIAARLNKDLPGANLNTTDVFYLMALGALELDAHPWSPWINVFRPDDWVVFNYISGLIFYHCHGPGNPYEVASGSVFVNATLTALNESPEKNPLLLNFGHDGQLASLMGALGLADAGDLPTDRVRFNSPWQFNDISPMGGHAVFERLNCSATEISPAGTYVRIVWNEGVIPVPECQNGPGFSCPLQNFTDHYRNKLPNYAEKCGLPKDLPQYFDMWWNYNTSTDFNYLKGPISCGLKETME